MKHSQSTRQLRIDTEESILSACLCDREAFQRVMHLLTPQNFRGVSCTGEQITYANVWTAMQECYKTRPIDILTVTRTMLPQFSCPQLGYAISLLTDRCATGCHIEFHAVLLIELSIRETAMELTDQWMDDAEGQKLDDFNELFLQFRNLRACIFRGIEKGVSFLKEHGYPDESDELQGLLGMIAKRMIQIIQRLSKKHNNNRHNSEGHGE